MCETDTQSNWDDIDLQSSQVSHFYYLGIAFNYVLNFSQPKVKIVMQCFVFCFSIRTRGVVLKNGTRAIGMTEMVGTTKACVLTFL